jgi:hypothetical protein
MFFRMKMHFLENWKFYLSPHFLLLSLFQQLHLVPDWMLVQHPSMPAQHRQGAHHTQVMVPCWKVARCMHHHILQSHQAFLPAPRQG